MNPLIWLGNGFGGAAQPDAGVHNWEIAAGMGGLTADIVQVPTEPLVSQTVQPVLSEKGAKPSIITQQGNPYNLFGAIPIILGKVKRFYPYVSANGWNSYREGKNNNDYYLGLDFGYAPLKIEEIKVGEVPIEDLAEEQGPGRPAIEYQLRETIDDAAVTIVPYDTQTIQIAKELKHNDAQIERVPQIADLIIIGLEFPSGLYTTGDPPTDATVEFKFEYREVDGDVLLWTTIDNSWEYTADGTERILKGYEWEPPDTSAHYEIRVTRKTAITEDGSKVDTVNWFNLEAIIYSDPWPREPLDANGEDCAIARIGIKAKANDQVQGALDPISAYCQALVPQFKEGFGSLYSYYAVDDAVVEGGEIVNEITDISGNDHHGTLAAPPVSGPVWVEDGRPYLQFDMDTVIYVDWFFRWEPASLIYADFSGYYQPTQEPMGNPELSRRALWSYGNEFALFYDPETEGLYLQGFRKSPWGVFEICRLDGVSPINEHRQFVLSMISDGTNIYFDLNLYETGLGMGVGSADGVAKIDGLAYAATARQFYIGGRPKVSGQHGDWKGTLYDFEFLMTYEDPAAPGSSMAGEEAAEWPIDDDDMVPGEIPELEDPNEITDTGGAERHGTLHKSDVAEWTEEEPYRLNFNAAAYISLPIPLVIDDTTNLEAFNHAYISGKFIADTSATENPILSIEGDKIIIWQEPLTSDVVLYIGTETPIEIRMTDAAPNDAERHFWLHLFNVGSGANAVLTIYDEDHVQLAQDGDGWDAAGFLDSGEIRLGSARMPTVVIGDPTEITDTSGQNRHGVMYATGEVTWTEIPTRLNFDGTVHVVVDPMPIYEDDDLESITWEVKFLATTSPNTDYTPIMSANQLSIQRDETNDDLVVKLRNSTELRVVDAAPLDLERRVLLTITRDGSDFDCVVEVYDETDTLIDTDSDTISVNQLKDAAFVDIGLKSGRWFYGNIWDVNINHTYPDPNAGSDYVGEYLSELAIDDNVGGDPPSTFYTGQIWDVDVSIDSPPFGAVDEDSTTSNPALLSLYLMRSASFNPRPVPDDKIDFNSFYVWANICDEKGYEYNAVIDQPTMLFNALEDVGRVGRASVIRKNGIYVAAVDISATHEDGPKVVQSFNRANSSAFKMVTNRDFRTHAWRVNWLDPSDDNNQGQVVVYAKYGDITYNATNATRYKVADAKGITTRDGAKREGRRLIAEEYYRSSRQYELTTDWESLLCSKNDLVHVTHSAGLIGITGGYITAINTSGSDIISIDVDQGCTMEDGTTYQVHMRQQLTAEPIIAEVENDGDGLYYTLVFATPIPSSEAPSLEVGSLFSFGEENKVTRLLRVSRIERMPDHNARLLLDEYHEALFDFEEDAATTTTLSHSSLGTPFHEYRRTMPTITLSPIFSFNPLVAVATWHDYVASPDERAATQTWWRKVSAGPSYTPQGDWEYWIQTPANYSAAVTRQSNLINEQWYEVKAKPIVKDGRIGEFSNSVYAMALVGEGEGDPGG